MAPLKKLTNAMHWLARKAAGAGGGVRSVPVEVNVHATPPLPFTAALEPAGAAGHTPAPGTVKSSPAVAGHLPTVGALQKRSVE